MSARELPLPSGPARFAVAGLIILVGVIAAVLDLSPLAIVIVIVVGLAWVVVALVRVAKSSRPRRASRSAVAPLEPAVQEELAEDQQPERERRFSEPGHAPGSGSPGEWNLWELERRARKHAGADVVREEWAAIFMYLREFAKSDGVLPPHFDSLVRESFPELTRVG